MSSDGEESFRKKRGRAELSCTRSGGECTVTESVVSPTSNERNVGLAQDGIASSSTTSPVSPRVLTASPVSFRALTASPKSTVSLYARRRQEMQLKASTKKLTVVVSSEDKNGGLFLDPPVSTNSSSGSAESSCSGLSSLASPNLSVVSEFSPPARGLDLQDKTCFQESPVHKKRKHKHKGGGLKVNVSPLALSSGERSKPCVEPNKWWESRLVRQKAGTLGVVYSPVGSSSSLPPSPSQV